MPKYHQVRTAQPAMTTQPYPPSSTLESAMSEASTMLRGSAGVKLSFKSSMERGEAAFEVVVCE
jgi:hypothetical protein